LLRGQLTDHRTPQKFKHSGHKLYLLRIYSLRLQNWELTSYGGAQNVKRAELSRHEFIGIDYSNILETYFLFYLFKVTSAAKGTSHLHAGKSNFKNHD